MCVLLAAGLALAATGCGGGDEPTPSLPQASIAKLNERLGVVERQFKAGGGACADIANNTRPVIESDLEALPDSVDPDTRKALNDSFENLFQLVDDQCDTASEPTPTDTQQTETVPTETQETQTEQTQTEQTQTQEKQKPDKPEKPKGGGGGGSNGGGGGSNNQDGGAAFGEGN